MVHVGDPAPDFYKHSHTGKRLHLAELRSQVVVLYFYPKDDTPGCTIEACGFRDAWVDFVAAGAMVIGVSMDSLDSHKAFSEKFDLPFELISDADGRLREAYGVPSNMFGLIPGRVTYVIDRQGIVRHMFESQIRAAKHVREALRMVREL